MNITQIPLPAVEKKLLISTGIVDVNCQQITREIGQYRYDDALDVMCAVNQLDEPIQSLEAEGVKESKIKRACSVALAILANNYNHLLNDEERNDILGEYNNNGYSLKYCEKGGLFIPIIDEPIPYIFVV